MGLFFSGLANMSFNRFVEIGRVAFVPDEGKLVAIVDIIDGSRALVDGPCSGVARKAIPFKKLHLTKYVINIPHSARTGVVKKRWEEAKINGQWEESTWAKKLASREKRASLTDFDRFKLMKAKQTRNRLVNIQFGKLRKAAKKAGPKKHRVDKKPHKK